MLKNEKKKIVFKRLDAELKPLGWKRVCDSGHNPIYVFDNSFYKVKFDIQFVKEPIEFFPIELAIKEVEPYITECIGDTEWIPGRGILIDNKTMFRTTIEDKTNLEKYNDYVVKTEDDVNKVVDYFLEYLFGTAKKFVETYLYLPNIVRKMEELDKENIFWFKYDKGIIWGGVEGFFRGLVISKLCDDPLFEDKVKYIDGILYNPEYQNSTKLYIPYYEKLKQLLPTIEPKYSMDSPNEEAEMEKIRAMVAKNFTPVSAPTDKPKKKTAKKFVPTPPEQVNKELLALLGSEENAKENRGLQQLMDFFFGKKDSKEKTESIQLQRNTIEIVGSYIDVSLRNHGFCNVHRYKNVFYYTRPTDIGNLIFSFMVGNNGCLCINPPSIRLDKVEEWMQKIDIQLKSRDGDHQGTIELELPKKIVKLNDSECINDDDVKKLCLATWQFIEEKFGDFVEDYSSPQFLWERLCSDIKAYPDWVKIIRGITAPEQIIRGVVFLRLCRDNDFEDKFELVKKFILTEYKSFIPSVNQLKHLLPEMKKEYEVCC
ncbi:hypothetical protein SAMN05216518_103148 [Bacteroidales bacterium KHT7]|nr:hypothetical protein SAMN05216518_103148 [Bacteroidales bacterium KHT7]